ncbi:hypothetical protein ACJJIW_07470 [Microbulbifer sp. JMSA004]|uniref:hypothetical protein n=1 Tax=unclassified Microbulbifer TaxID=2619833 RepID=UPI0024ACED44|nr:hypothetical protein [Microbulbifer sp. VAAF005]WHI45110.1 hypothetical protein P0078_15405 [Microbulbifer sp. VAAF005]
MIYFGAYLCGCSATIHLSWLRQHFAGARTGANRDYEAIALIWHTPCFISRQVESECRQRQQGIATNYFSRPGGLQCQRKRSV